MTPLRNTKQNHYFISFQNGTVIFTMKTSTINLSTHAMAPWRMAVVFHQLLLISQHLTPMAWAHETSAHPLEDTFPEPPWRPSTLREKGWAPFGDRWQITKQKGQEVGGACSSDWLSYVMYIYIYTVHVYIIYTVHVYIIYIYHIERY